MPSQAEPGQARPSQAKPGHLVLLVLGALRGCPAVDVGLEGGRKGEGEGVWGGGWVEEVRVEAADALLEVRYHGRRRRYGGGGKEEVVGGEEARWR